MKSRPAPQAASAGLPVPVLVSDETASALLVGLIRPAIVLPARLVAERPAEELSLICAHELAHLRRRDNWRILADQALAAVLWFNPPARRCIARLVALREELCDAAVLAGADPEHRRRYAAVLLAALRLASDAGRGRGGVQPAFNRHQGSDQAMRLNAILHPTASSSRRAVAAAAGLVLLASLSAGLVGAAFAQPLAGVAADATRQSVKARYESASAVDYQRACASDEPTDYGFCTGVIFGVLSSQDPGICQPGTSDYLGMEKQARAAIAAARPEANEGPRVFVSRVLRADFSCEKLKGETSSGVQITSDLALTKGDVTTFEGSPTIRIIGPIGKSLLLVDGRKPAPDFDVNALPPGAIARITVAKADSQEARNLGAAPGQSVLNLELKRG